MSSPDEDMNNLSLEEPEPPSPTFHLFPSLPRNLQVLIYKWICFPTNGYNEGGDGFVHYIDYWHSARQPYISLYSTLMNTNADSRNHHHPGRKALLRTCRLAREISLMAWRQDIMTSSIPDWALKSSLEVRKELVWQIDFQVAKTRRDPPPSFSKFPELPFDLQYYIWRMVAASEKLARDYDMPRLMGDLIRDHDTERPLKMPGWYYCYMDAWDALPRNDPYFPRARAGLLKACRASRLAALVEFKLDLEGLDRSQLRYCQGDTGMDRMERELDEKIGELRKIMDD